MLGAVAGIFACTAAFAQAENQDKVKNQEIFVAIGGGMSTLQYDTKLGNSESAAGWNFGVGYSYRLNQAWSINGGLELARYESSMKGSEYKDSYKANDGVYDFTFTSQVTDYSESQKAMYLNIPITAQYELAVGNMSKFYAAGGVKLGVPLSSKYTVEQPTIYNVGYFPDLNITYDYLNYKGFGTFYPVREEYDLGLKLAVSLTIETGMKWKLSDKMNLYTGVYADYGITSVKPADVGKFVNYDTTVEESFVLNSVLNSSQTTGGALSGKVRPISYGLKIRMALPF